MHRLGLRRVASGGHIIEIDEAAVISKIKYKKGFKIPTLTLLKKVTISTMQLATAVFLWLNRGRISINPPRVGA